MQNKSAKAEGVYVCAVREFLKSERKKLGGARAMYVLLYSQEPTVSEEKRLINLIGRGALTAEFLGLCVDKLGLGEVTLAHAFGLSDG